MRNTVLIGVPVKYTVKRIKKNKEMGRTRKIQDPLRWDIFVYSSFYWAFIILSKTIVKGIAIDRTFIELSISKKFSLRMAASLFHYL